MSISMDPWVLVACGFHRNGGMEKANAALAAHLLDRGIPVHLVGHSIDPELASRPGVTCHIVARPAGFFLMGERLLDRRGRAVAREVLARWPGARVVVNGGNCFWPDINWVHSVHHAWPCVDEGAPLWFRAKNRWMKSSARRRERVAIRRARLVVANSEKTRSELIEHLEVDPGKVRTVYLGAEEGWGAARERERAAARDWLQTPGDRPMVVFIGALGYDHNKGIDTLLAAWQRLSAEGGWDAELVVAGAGRGSSRWHAEATRRDVAGSVRFLGFTGRVPELLAAADLLVSPVRYEAYGLNVQEAICRGVPALVSSRAGVAERYPSELSAMVLRDPADVDELARRLRDWRAAIGPWKERFAPLAARLREYTWQKMASSIVTLAEEA